MIKLQNLDRENEEETPYYVESIEDLKERLFVETGIKFKIGPSLEVQKTTLEKFLKKIDALREDVF